MLKIGATYTYTEWDFGKAKETFPVEYVGEITAGSDLIEPTGGCMIFRKEDGSLWPWASESFPTMIDPEEGLVADFVLFTPTPQRT